MTGLISIREMQERAKLNEEKRDSELLQLSKNIRQLRGKFNDKGSLELLETTLRVNADITRQEYGGV